MKRQQYQVIAEDQHGVRRAWGIGGTPEEAQHQCGAEIAAYARTRPDLRLTARPAVPCRPCLRAGRGASTEGRIEAAQIRLGLWREGDRTFRAAYVGDCRLTGPEHADLLDADLLAEALAEARRANILRGDA